MADQSTEQLGYKLNFGKLSPEEQKRISRERMPENHDAPAENEKLALENARKLQEDESRNVN